MARLLEKVMWNEARTSVLTTMRIIIYFVVVTYFGGYLVCCDQGILVCDRYMEKLKEDVQDWTNRCVSSKGKNESNTTCCQENKKYNQERIRMITEMCFHDGPYPVPHMLVSTRSEIYAIDLITLDKSVVVRGLNNNFAMAVDTVDRKLYYRDEDKLYRSNIDGSGKNIVLKRVKVWKMTVDWIGRRLFWTNHDNKKIEVVNLNGEKKERRVLLITLEEKNDIAVDPTAGYIFWTEDTKVLRMNLVSKKIVTVANKYNANGAITLHYNNKSVYWIDRPKDSRIIFSSDYDGRGKKVIASGISKFYLLGMFGDLLYFQQNGYINEMNASNGSIYRYIPIKSSDYRQLIIVDSSKQPTDKEGCPVSPCGHFGYCNTTNSSYSCQCEAGFSGDGRSCTDIDECLLSPCGSNSNISCINTQGSYKCANCSDGFIKTSDVCTANSELQIKLVNSTNNKTGRVQIYHPAFGWGTVCNDNWGNTESDVVCRQLGFTRVKAKRMDAYYGAGSGPIFLDEIDCIGNEAYIWDCQHSGWNVHDCFHAEDVGVDCY